MTTPESLLIDPCEPLGAGDTARLIAKGYAANTSCLGQYKLLLEKQRRHRDEMELIYEQR